MSCGSRNNTASHVLVTGSSCYKEDASICKLTLSGTVMGSTGLTKYYEITVDSCVISPLPQGAGCTYTMQHIKEFDSSHRLVGQQGIRLKVSWVQCHRLVQRPGSRPDKTSRNRSFQMTKKFGFVVIGSNVNSKTQLMFHQASFVLP